jgi:hypothetical protein
VGIFEAIVTTHTLGRRTGPRTRHTIEEKLRIVEETRAKGASVAMVARRHNLNANQVFAWRRLEIYEFKDLSHFNSANRGSLRGLKCLFLLI